MSAENDVIVNELRAAESALCRAKVSSVCSRQEQAIDTVKKSVHAIAVDMAAHGVTLERAFLLEQAAKLQQMASVTIPSSEFQLEKLVPALERVIEKADSEVSKVRKMVNRLDSMVKPQDVVGDPDRFKVMAGLKTPHPAGGEGPEEVGLPVEEFRKLSGVEEEQEVLKEKSEDPNTSTGLKLLIAEHVHWWTAMEVQVEQAAEVAYSLIGSKGVDIKEEVWSSWKKRVEEVVKCVKEAVLTLSALAFVAGVFDIGQSYKEIDSNGRYGRAVRMNMNGPAYAMIDFVSNLSPPIEPKKPLFE